MQKTIEDSPQSGTRQTTNQPQQLRPATAPALKTPECPPHPTQAAVDDPRCESPEEAFRKLYLRS